MKINCNVGHINIANKAIEEVEGLKYLDSIISANCGAEEGIILRIEQACHAFSMLSKTCGL